MYFPYLVAIAGLFVSSSATPHPRDSLVGKALHLTPTPALTASIPSALDEDGDWAVAATANFTLTPVGASASSAVFTLSSDKADCFVALGQLRCDVLPVSDVVVNSLFELITLATGEFDLKVHNGTANFSSALRPEVGAPAPVFADPLHVITYAIRIDEA